MINDNTNKYYYILTKHVSKMKSKRNNRQRSIYVIIMHDYNST